MPVAQPTTRVDETGRAFKGSQRQVQNWVNDHPTELNEAILAHLPRLAALQPVISWRSPLSEERYREYRDTAFLDRIGHPELAVPLAAFWPARGPRWDGFATYEAEHAAPGLILVEGKSYPHELYGRGCQAGVSGSEASRRSRIQIAAALQQTQTWLGLSDPPDWMGPLYQTANRLAHLYWLRERAGIETWLVHLLFENDRYRRTTHAQWELELARADRLLGLTQPLGCHANLILEALDA